MTGIYIKRRYGDMFVDVMSLQMRSSALALSNSSQTANNVEQCVCDVSSNVQGL